MCSFGVLTFKQGEKTYAALFAKKFIGSLSHTLSENPRSPVGEPCFRPGCLPAPSVRAETVPPRTAASVPAQRSHPGAHACGPGVHCCCWWFLLQKGLMTSKCW